MAGKRPEELAARISLETDRLGEIALVQVAGTKHVWSGMGRRVEVFGLGARAWRPWSFP